MEFALFEALVSGIVFAIVTIDFVSAAVGFVRGGE